MKGSVNFYETPSTVKTLGAFWVRTESDYAKARNIIEEYTKELVASSKEEYERKLQKDFDGSELNWLLYNLSKNKFMSLIGFGLFIFIVWHLIAYILVRYS